MFNTPGCLNNFPSILLSQYSIKVLLWCISWFQGRMQDFEKVGVRGWESGLWQDFEMVGVWGWGRGVWGSSPSDFSKFNMSKTSFWAPKVGIRTPWTPPGSGPDSRLHNYTRRLAKSVVRHEGPWRCLLVTFWLTKLFKKFKETTCMCHSV